MPGGNNAHAAAPAARSIQTMIVSVGDISARCKGCEGRDFRAADSEAVRLTTRMTCAGCGRVTTYRELLESIGEEAMQRANDALEKLRKTRPRPAKPRK